VTPTGNFPNDHGNSGDLMGNKKAVSGLPLQPYSRLALQPWSGRRWFSQPQAHAVQFGHNVYRVPSERE
jgi:hypothetical protein